MRTRSFSMVSRTRVRVHAGDGTSPLTLRPFVVLPYDMVNGFTADVKALQAGSFDDRTTRESCKLSEQ